jgi:hypothetical protein
MTEAPDPNRELRLRLHPGWWARLEGEEFDLTALAGALGDSSPVQIRRFDGRYYLRMAQFDQFNESSDVETRAGEILRIVNGAGRVEYGNSREVRVDAAARVHPDGQIQHFVHLSGAIHARSRVSDSVHALGDQARHGHEATQPPSQPMSLAEAQALVGRILRVWFAATT